MEQVYGPYACASCACMFVRYGDGPAACPLCGCPPATVAGPGLVDRGVFARAEDEVAAA